MRLIGNSVCFLGTIAPMPWTTRKRQMREIAEGYERLAERAERRLAEPM
jgi:hypothetical protein